MSLLLYQLDISYVILKDVKNAILSGTESENKQSAGFSSNNQLKYELDWRMGAINSADTYEQGYITKLVITNVNAQFAQSIYDSVKLSAISNKEAGGFVGLALTRFCLKYTFTNICDAKDSFYLYVMPTDMAYSKLSPSEVTLTIEGITPLLGTVTQRTKTFPIGTSYYNIALFYLGNLYDIDDNLKNYNIQSPYTVQIKTLGSTGSILKPLSDFLAQETNNTKSLGMELGSEKQVYQVVVKEDLPVYKAKDIQYANITDDDIMGGVRIQGPRLDMKVEFNSKFINLYFFKVQATYQTFNLFANEYNPDNLYKKIFMNINLNNTQLSTIQLAMVITTVVK